MIEILPAIGTIAILFFSVFVSLVLTGTITGSVAEIEEPEPYQLEMRDRDLLTHEQKIEARESGFASYTFDGMHYVDGTVPPEYYLD